MTEPVAEKTRKLFAQTCDFVLAASEPAHLPKSKIPEIAFIGRSNVGKSSLLNALVDRKNLARSSNTPGRTQQIIFFDLAQRLMLVDLPGYGHAKAPQTQRKKWEGLVHTYLKKREALRCTLLLIDARHGIMEHDEAMMKLLDRAAASYQIVLTKADQLRGTGHDTKQGQILEILAKHPAARPEILLTSAEKKIGMDKLRTFLAEFALPPAKG
jgi:GTP-binding protein